MPKLCIAAAFQTTLGWARCGACAAVRAGRSRAFTSTTTGAAPARRLELWAADGTAHDHFMQLTEGVIAREELGARSRVARERRVEARAGSSSSSCGSRGRAGRLRVELRPRSRRARAERRRRAAAAGLRLGARAGRAASRASAPGTAAFDQAGRASSSAPIAATPGPLPARDARERRDPAGRLRAGAVAALERTATRCGCETSAPARASSSTRAASRCRRARPRGRCACTSSPTRRRRPGCARYLRADRAPGAAARVGLRALEEPRRLRAPATTWRTTSTAAAGTAPARRDRDRLALGDAIQHLGVQPPPVPDCAGMIGGWARAGCGRWSGSRPG